MTEPTVKSCWTSPNISPGGVVSPIPNVPIGTVSGKIRLASGTITQAV